VNPTDAETLMLLMAHMLALAVACLIFFWMIYLHRRARAAEKLSGNFRFIHPAFPQRPASWLAVRSRDRQVVQAALESNSSKPRNCKWFIAPPVNGWTIVAGPGLPNPTDDVDECFHFLTALSRELGHVQFFYAEKVLHHHAWARMDDGCVTRAYAWAGETLWNQGCKTVLEIQLQLKCFHYGEAGGAWETAGLTASNVEKIPLLAAHWSIDPGKINELLAAGDGNGADESSQFY
jgi:hypothetical protein